MEVVLLMLVSFFGYIIAYNTYGRFISRKVFKIDKNAKVPSKELEDGVDYVPTKRRVIFGHHFASIAGTGPIVGPAIGVIWGWLPAFLWIFVGSIFMGAVHDFGSLIISMRNDGRSVSDITDRFINKRVRTIFFIIIFFALLIVVAIFALVIASIFKMYSDCVFAVWMQIPIAIGMGYCIYSRKMHLGWITLIAVVLMYISIVGAHFIPGLSNISIPDFAGIPSTGVWAILLFIYAFIASVLPVTVLLQPRDYINTWQLIIAMILLITGIFASGFFGKLEFAAPVYNHNPTGAPSIYPFLFITIACGAVSGFHSLVSSGTSSKQVSSEQDTQFIGYGSMLTESFLAVLVLIAVSAGIGIAYNFEGSILTGTEAWNHHYSSWVAAKGLGPKLSAFVDGAANMLRSLGIPQYTGLAIMGVFVASFAGTTLDSATRIQRYIISEACRDTKFSFMQNKYLAGFFAVFTAGLLAFSTGASGKGALALWPMFGAVNQLLAALVLLIISVYLRKKNKSYAWVTAIPCLVLTLTTIYAAIMNEINFILDSSDFILEIVNGIVLLLAFWMIIECLIEFRKARKIVN